MKESEIIGAGIYQFEFLEDEIAVTACEAIPPGTEQWLIVSRKEKPQQARFQLKGTSLNDLCVVEVEDAP